MKDAMGTRMKENYENRAKTFLLRRTPVIIRIDGKAFHAVTKNFKKPYDNVMSNAMVHTATSLVNLIQGCKIGYTQSDEISLLLIDYENLNTEAWYDYNVQKICSISAAIAASTFTHYMSLSIYKDIGSVYFDSRCFNIPKEEVCNYFIWRQRDAIRNSINSLAQSYFSHSELLNLNVEEVQSKLINEKNTNWNDLSTRFKRGICVNKDGINDEIPLFSEDRMYIDKYVMIK